MTRFAYVLVIVGLLGIVALVVLSVAPR